MSKRVVRLMLDSGAFGAWTRDETLDIQKYIEYVKVAKPFLHSYVNLDVIPGKHGRMRTQKEVELSASQSYENLQIMKQAGLAPIPVFHQGENFSWLEKLLDDGEPYIGISAFKDIPMRTQRDWLDLCFTMLSDRKGNPYVKVHGFAITNHPLLKRYPWYSVDSTTWSLSPSYGFVLVPSYENGKPNYLKRSHVVVVSGIRQKGGNQEKQFELHYYHGSENITEHVRKFLHDEVGVTITDVRYDPKARQRAFLTYFMKVAEAIDCSHFAHRIPLIGKAPPTKRAKPATWKCHIMFATSFKNKQWGKLLTEVGANNRLLSYYDLKDMSIDVLREYVTTGNLMTRQPRRQKQHKPNKSYDDWSDERKAALVAESNMPNVRPADVAIAAGVNPTTFGAWRAKFCKHTPIISQWRREAYKNARRNTIVTRAKEVIDGAE